ncbi:adenylosuccinate synthetase [Rhizobium leguminosarum]|uniref:Adenylosuccinate synthetase n=1 Tax=Rhizobium leguminosarum TaxID=384 RepID=A0A2K9ZGP1_RHILE|nr:adenylosuccinate synthetase [Rhizobium leguminosarum]AUW47201.1 Adenylosuccinate synthetase [Rhizobium leguminosarum]
MLPIFLLSGPISVGKSALVKEFELRFGAMKVSTRQLLLRQEPGGERDALIKLGLELDETTAGKWVLDNFLTLAGKDLDTEIWLIDAVRTKDQIRHIRERFGDRVVHVHLSAPIGVLRQRYLDRPPELQEFANYDEAKQHGTEKNIEDLASIADRKLDANINGPASLLALAAGGLNLFPQRDERLVDVLVGAQYGSEGKGNICAHIAKEYQVLVRVGGPNAGHKVAHPKYDYIQLPSGTQSNPEAKILIGAGATLSVKQVLKEIADLGLTGDRLSIDPQAIIIEDNDVAVEMGSLEVIGSTKKGVGVATARKILGRGDHIHFEAPVRLAKHIPEFRDFLRCTKVELEKAYARGDRVLLEGTQGTDLSIHHGEYPYVTSRETTASGCLADAGIPPTRVRRVIMVMRTYPIRVGGTSGPMMKQIDFQTIADRSGMPVSALERIEKGTVSGKIRRIGEFDWEQARRSAVLNGATDIALTFADYIDASNKDAVEFDMLSVRTKAFVAEVERVANTRVSWITKDFGPDAIVIDRRKGTV